MRIDVAFNLPPAHPGCSSRSSGRAMHASRIEASRAKSATCSTSSRNFGSAHCRSSIEKTSGRSAARCSSSVLIAQNISSGAVSLPAMPIAWPTSSAILPASSSGTRERFELRAGGLRRVGLAQIRDLDRAPPPAGRT